MASIDPRPNGKSTLPRSIAVTADPGQKATHPSGSHEFLEKYVDSGCWKEVAEDDSGAGLVDCDAESVDTISVDQCHIPVSEDIQDGANVPRDETNETVVKKSAVDPLGESDITLLQLNELDGTLVDAEETYDVTVDPVGGFGTPRVDSPKKDVDRDLGMGSDAIFEFEEPENMTVNAIKESNKAIKEKADDLHNITAPRLGNSDAAPDAPDEAVRVDITGAVEPDPIVSGYDKMDVDILGAKGKPELGEGYPIEVANTLCTMSQYPNPLPSGGLGSWQVVNRPKMDPRELLRSWNWVFQTGNR